MAQRTLFLKISWNKQTTRAYLSYVQHLFILLVFLVSLAGVPAIGVRAASTITFTGEELLGRPTDTSITINIVPATTIEYHYQYGTSPGLYSDETDNYTATGGQPHEIVISGLSPNTQYYYRMQYHAPGDEMDDWVSRAEHSFWTQRSQGSSFTFTITSDSHVSIMLGSAATWRQTMTNVAGDHPDFEVDLGDTFAMDNVTTATGADSAYLTQRQYFDLVGNSSAIFLAPGNHEEQEGWHLDDYGDPASNQPVWGTNAQKKYYLNPVPDGFYTGDAETYPYLDGDQLREDYYAWTWGDALFVVIDPFWFTTTKPFIGNTGGGESSDTGSGDRWDWSLGLTQFNWLKTTLQNSDAKYKFIFAHHMVGGSDDYVRGGANPAHIVEWGGYDENGTTWGWDSNRDVALWGNEPVHQILIDNNVSAFFHGHDHQYAYEERDNIVYQSLPAAGFSGNGFNIYTTGSGYTIQALPSPGHLRVTVNPEDATVDYVATSGGAVNYSYTIEPGDDTTPRYNLTLAVDPVGSGTTNPTIGTHRYTEDTVVNVTAAPAAGYVFDQWSGDCSGSGACQVTMDDDKSVTAHFVTAPNQPPVVGDIPNQTIAEGTSFTTINLDNYVSDVDNTDAEMTWSASGNTALNVSITNRVATISVPNADWNGSETITFRATDPGALYDEDAATFTVTAINDAPVVSDIPDQTIAEGASFTTLNLDNYVSDVDNTDAEMTWSASGATDLSVSIVNRVATITTPNADWNGSETITFRATDPGAFYDEDAATFTVTAVNDAPQAVDDTYTAVEDTTLNVPAPGVLGNDSDIDGDPMTAVKLSDPSHGAVTLNTDGSFSYTPAALYNGPDSFTYQASDGTVGSNTATVHINVGGVNNAPVCTATSLTTAEDTAGEVAPACTDADGDTLNYSIVAQPSHGSASVVAGMLRYTPSSNYNGSDSFTYQANDGTLDSNVAAVSVTVTPVNDAPVLAAIGDKAVNELVLLSFSAQATDVDGDALTFSLDSGAPAGAMIQPASGLFTWTPTEAQGPGSYPVTIRVSDGTASDSETITITVSEVNQAPVASDDVYTTKQDTPLSVPVGTGVLANDSDGDGNTITAVLINLPEKGVLVLNSDGSFTYTPEVGFFGSVTFSYRAFDGQFYSENAQVRINIINPETVPNHLFLPLIQRNP